MGWYHWQNRQNYGSWQSLCLSRQYGDQPNRWNDPIAFANNPNSSEEKAMGSGPIELHAYDKEGRHTGTNKNGSIDTEIPGSCTYISSDGGIHELAILTKEEIKIVVKAKEDGRFNLTLGDYTQKVYLNFEVIKMLTKMDWQKAAELDIKLLIQLPFILRFMEYQNKEMANIFIQVMDLKEYVKLIEKLEIQHLHILKERKHVDDWVECFDKLTKILPKMQKKGLTIFKKNIEAMKAFGG